MIRLFCQVILLSLVFHGDPENNAVSSLNVIRRMQKCTENEAFLSWFLLQTFALVSLKGNSRL